MTSSVTDLVNQGVQLAVNSLEELADRMTSDDFGFKEDDVANVDAVIEAIRDLEKERKRVHEELETETIKASIIRHRLQFLPAEIKSELQDAVNSARQSNAQALSELQEQLNKIRETIAYLQKQHEELEKENSVLHPERELIRHQHEEIISKLNQRMAEKASMQITLNETRDMVRQANQSIVDLEDGILQLKEDLIQERTEARHEKKRLKKAVADTQEKTKEQKEQNHSKKKDLDKIQFELIESETKLQNIRKGIRRHDTSRQRLEAQERALRGQLSKVKRQNEELRMKGATIVNDTLREEQIFQDKKHQMENKLRRFEEEAIKEGKKQAEFDQKRYELERLYRDLITKLQDDKEEVEAGNGELQAIKGKLTEKAEEVGQMQSENIKMEEAVEQLKEDHMAVIAQLKNQIEEYRDQLTRERKDRMELQQHKDDVGKTLDNVKGDNQKFMMDLNKRIQAGKSKHVELAREGTQLQADLKEQEVELQDLESRLAVSRQGYETMYDALNAAVVHLEGNISGTQALLEAKVRELEDEGPKFKDLEETFQQTTEEYDVKKKNIVSLKNKKSSLEDSIKRLKIDKDKMTPPIAELRMEVKKSKQELLGQMKNQGQNTSGIEQRIYVEGLKLRTVLEENMKFEENCQALERELSDLQEQLEANDKIKNSLNNEFMSVRGLLFNSWQDDSEMQHLFEARDKQMVEAFEDLLRQTLHREEKIEDVSKRLQGELEILTGFLENVSTRRPRAFGLPRSALGLSGKSTPSSLYTGDSQNSSRKASAKSSRAGSRRDAVEAVAAANQGSVSLAPSPSHHSTPGGTKTPRSTMLSARNQPSARSAARSRSAKSVTISTPNSPTKEVIQ